MTEALGVPKVINIVVNGRDYPITEGVEASYEDIVATAWKKEPTEGEVYTVTYSGKSNGNSRVAGSLAPGDKKIRLEDGMVFNCLMTDNA